MSFQAYQHYQGPAGLHDWIAGRIASLPPRRPALWRRFVRKILRWLGW
jgi:hypothetical protein